MLPPKNSAMTKRKLEVLRLLAKGCKDKEIGKELYLSVYTVYSHVKKSFASWV
jgi:DNA-binding NarL/FixJ family response regulator